MPPRRFQPIADAEMTVLKALWAGGARTVRELMSLLEGDGADWAYTTVQTLLQRLCDKGYAIVDKATAAHRFAAAVTREQMAEERVQEVVDDVLDGALAPLLLGLLPQGRFSQDEIDHFRKLLNDKESETPRDDGKGRPQTDGPGPGTRDGSGAGRRRRRS